MPESTNIKHLTYDDLTNLQYQLIFDYYDQPLSFIAQIKTQNYLFYFISDNQWFITEVNQDIIDQLNLLKNLTPLYQYLYQHDELFVVTFDHSKQQVTYQPAKRFAHIMHYLPISNKPITFDYEHKIKITKTTDLRQFLN